MKASSSLPQNDAPSGWLLRTSGALLVVLVAAFCVLIFNAPADRIQGVIQKIIYVHVPSAFAAYLGFAITAISGGLYLWKDEERFDRVAICGAEVGLIFCTLTVVTGPIWGKGTWGHWWVWDPRLTVTLLLFFIYLAYLLLRGFTEGSERAGRFAAVYGIAGLFAVPLNYFAIDLFGGAALHPENLERGSLGSGMGWPFAVAVATGLAAFTHLLLLRVDLEVRRAADRDRQEDLI